MELRVLKYFYLTPWIRLNLFTKGFSISFGEARLGWITVGKSGLTETIDTGVSGVYVKDSQRWDKVLKLLKLRK